MSNFKEQLKTFMSDTSYKEKFKDIEITDSYLIEIFKFKTKDKSMFSFEGKVSDLLMIGLDGQVKNISDVFVDYTHVAKILKVGKGLESQKYNEGDCVLLNPFDVTGKAKNPEFALYEQFEHSIGHTPIMPEGLLEHIPAIQARYLEYQFVLPEDYNIGTQNITTFLVPEYKIKAKYNI